MKYEGSDASFNWNEVAKRLNIQIRPKMTVEQAQDLAIYKYDEYNDACPMYSVDIDGFFELVGNVLIDIQQKAGIPEKYWLFYTQTHPDYGVYEGDDNINTIDKPIDGILYKLKKRELGNFGQRPRGSKDVQNLAPIIVKDVPSTDYPGYNIRVSQMWMKNYVCFTPFSNKVKLADKRALWFEEVMMDYNWYFEMHGLKVVYEQRQEDITTDRIEQSYEKRPIVYWVRTTKVYHKLVKMLDNINLRYDVGNSVEVVRDAYGAYQMVSGLNA